MPKPDIDALLAAAISAYRQIPTDLPVGTAIQGISGCKVIPLDSGGADVDLLHKLCRAAEALIEFSHASPIQTGRVNELGNNIEEPLRNCCSQVGLVATWPLRLDGSGGRSGYPDIAINIGGPRPTYLEAKVIGAGSEASTFRSFYLSPSDRPKVCVDARHLLIAFVHDRLADSEDGYEQYRLLSYKIVDLARVIGKIKFEYQSSNKELYLGGSVVASG